MNEQYTRAPHRRSTGPVGSSPNAALMIDFDNVTMAIRSNLGQELRTFLNSDIIRGKVSVQRAYADWRRYPQYIVPLSEASIDLIFAPAYGSSKKNATDIRLAIDALELVFTRPEIGTFILLSGDSDFSSLVLKLKEYGKYVIGVGLQESTSDLLVQNCDEYYSYNSLSGLTEASQLHTISHDPWELVEMAVKKMAERDDVMRSDRLKQVMLEMDSAFDEKEHGFSKFNRFLAEASEKGLLRLQRIENGQYEVGPAEGREGSGRSTGASHGEGSGRSGERGRRGRRGGRDRSSGSGRGESRSAAPAVAPAPPSAGSRDGGNVDASSLKRAYDLLRDVVSRLSADGGAVRDSEVKRALLEEDERFDEAALGFSKFSRFLRQASDEGVVDLETDEDGNYHVSVSGPSSSGRAEGRESRDRSGGRRGGRGDRGRGREASREAEPTATAAEEAGETEEGLTDGAGAQREEPTTASAAAASMARSRVETEDAGQTADVGQAETMGETESAETPGAREPRDRGGRRGRGLGRFRRGSRGAGSDAGSDSHLPGPVDAGPPASEGKADERESAATRPAESHPGHGEERERHGVGLGRRGGRRGALPSDRRTSASGGDGPGAGGAAPSESGSSGAGSSEDGGAVEYMVKNYAGVGRKTAEALVDAFGPEVFTVIDEEPERITKVLPEHRAQAVIEAREAERQDTGSSDRA